MRRIHLYITWLVAYIYVLIKYEWLDIQSKFDNVGATVIVSIYYALPVFLFTTSAYIIIKAPHEKKWVVPTMGVLFTQILPVGLTWIGYKIVRFQHDGLEPFIKEYFLELNTGYLQPKSEDFRLEYFIVFVLNLVAFFIFIDKKIQPLLRRKSDDN